MIDIREGDFVQLISLKKLIKKYKGTVLDDGSAETNNGFYTPSMCDAMESGGVYKVTKVREKDFSVFVDIDGYDFIFYPKDIEHVYRIGLTKIM